MPSSRTRTRLASVHRWLAIGLSPVLVVILLSGIVLAFRPVVNPDDGQTAGPPAHVSVPRVMALADSLDARNTARAMILDPSRHTIALVAGRGRPAFYDLATGHPTTAPAEARRAPTVFDVAERIHKGGWFAGGLLVSLASIAMIVLVIAGPVLARPGRGRSALSWHIRTGWVLWPLVALAPLSLVMMKLHAPVSLGGNAAPVPFSTALRQAAQSIDLSGLAGIQRLPGATFIVVEDRAGAGRYVLRDGRVRRLDSSISNFGAALHEGTWAGRWSGLVNALGAVVTLVMLSTGMLSWVRRRSLADVRSTRPRTRIAA